MMPQPQGAKRRPRRSGGLSFPPEDGPVSLLHEDDLQITAGEIGLSELGECIARLRSRGDALLALRPPERCAEPASAVATRRRLLQLSGALLAAVGLILTLPRLGRGDLELLDVLLAFVLGPALLLWGGLTLRQGIRLTPLTVSAGQVGGGRLPFVVRFDQIERAGIVLQGDRSSVTLQVGVRYVQATCASEVPLLTLSGRMLHANIPTMVVWHATIASRDQHAARWEVILESADEEGAGTLPPLQEVDRIRSAREPIDPMEGLAPQD